MRFSLRTVANLVNLSCSFHFAKKKAIELKKYGEIQLLSGFSYVSLFI